MGTRLTAVPPPPSSHELLDEAYRRAYERLRWCVHACAENEVPADPYLLDRLRIIEHELTERLINAGVSNTLAYQLARPPVG